MSPDAWYEHRKGQSLLVPGAKEADRGQCMQAADYALNEIYGLPYIWANAIDCWYNYDNIAQLKNHFTRVTDGSVRAGDFIIFNEGVGSQYGHIDLAIWDGSISEYLGADSNWGRDKTVHLVWHEEPQWILGALRYNGGYMGFDYNGIPSDAEKKTFYEGVLGRTPTAADYANKVPWGKLNEDAMNEFKTKLSSTQKQLTDLENNPPGFHPVAETLYTKN